MKANEMTNEQLAKLISEGCGTSFMGHAIREAAARLRRPSAVDDELLKMASDIDKLRAKLKVADTALAKLQDRFVSSVYDGTIDPHEALRIAEEALAEIRREGGKK